MHKFRYVSVIRVGSRGTQGADGDDADALVRADITAAVLAERERCARACESEAHDEADDRFAAVVRALK